MGTGVRPEVVLISTYPPPGTTHVGSSGVASYTANLARAMAAEGAEVAVVAVVAPDESGAPPTHREDGVYVVRSGSRGPRALARSIGMAAAMSPRVIHLQHEMFLFGGGSSLLTNLLAVPRVRGLDSASIVTLHQVVDAPNVTTELVRLHRLRVPARVLRPALDAYQRSMSSFDAAIVHDDKGAGRITNAVVIPHGVESPPTPARSMARHRLGLTGERRLVVLCFGFVAPYKGLEVALAAAAALPEVLLVIAGGSHPRHGEVYAEALRRRWGDAGMFVGWVPEEDIAMWHSGADLALFCYPAPHSSSGSVATALAHRTPFLVSEALANRMGLPAEMAVTLDPAGLATALRSLAHDRRPLAQLRAGANQVARGRSWQLVARRHLQLYTEIGHREPGGSRFVRSASGHGQLEAS